jgi:hypothetical protein
MAGPAGATRVLGVCGRLPPGGGPAGAWTQGVARSGKVGERAGPRGDAPRQDRLMTVTPRTDVTVGKV